MKERIRELEDFIIKYKAHYYQGRSLISDPEYDKLEEELRLLSPNNPVLVIVGSFIVDENKVKHDTKMLSLNKTYSIDDLVSWKGNESILSTFKIDGVSCSLIYENGRLSLAKTRGDGVFGENITNKVLWISDVPNEVKVQTRFEVRGELFCTQIDFLNLSNEMTAIGLDRPSSQRNIVAGLMGRKDNLELSRFLCFRAFDIVTQDRAQFSFTTEQEKMDTLKDLNFIVPEYRVHSTLETILEAIEESKTFMSDENIEFQIDGLVFSINNLSLHEEMGETSHHPRYKMAFKFPGESRATKINKIVWQVSRNGILTPVAEVEPVELSGAMISRVTLHNYGVVRQFLLKKDDEIEIIRSGEVIPKFLSVIAPSSNAFEVPYECPSCKKEVTEVDIRLICKNEGCPDQIKETILNFVQKIGIEELSGKRLEAMINSGLVKSIPDLYRITPEDLLKLDKVKEKLSQKLVEEIQKSKKIDLATFLASLGLTGGAFSKCEKVVRAGFDSVEKILSLTSEDLQTIEGFAGKSSEDFYNSIQDKKELINSLVLAGFEITVEEKKSAKLEGLKICITGALSEKRPVAEEMIRDAGGIVVSSVSKNTNILVTNETDPNSSKFKKALELKIEIWTEEQLMKKIIS